MDILTIIEQRHSVRSYKKEAVGQEMLSSLKSEIDACNEESGLHIQLVTDEPKAFDCFMAHYGKFSNVTNYIALVGKKSADLEEKCGYYGERLVLKAQQLGLNTCWVASSYKKIPDTFKSEKDEKITAVIAVGLGENEGVPHKSKAPEDVSNLDEKSPEWFRKGVKAALLAPTALNQQKFRLELHENKVFAKAGIGLCTKIDLGIVKYNFEAAAGKENFRWE